MKLIAIFILLQVTFTAFGQNSIYNYSIQTLAGDSIHFSAFEGKKILLVNIATKGERNSQLHQLISLCHLFEDSAFVVVAFPTNDFFNEDRSNAQLDSLFANKPLNFIVSAKCAVTGENALPIYKWLTHFSDNGVLNSSVTGDFQKYLVNKTGNIMAVFSGLANPIDFPLREAIQKN